MSGADLKTVSHETLRVIDNYLHGSNQAQLYTLLAAMQWRVAQPLLAGPLCLSPSWPFIHTFEELPLGRRQAILRSWSNSRIPAFKKAYKAIKSILAAVILSAVDDSGNNPFWAAMGYVPGSAIKLPWGANPAATEAEEVVASAVLDLPRALQQAGADGLQAYLLKRGMPVQPAAANGSAAAGTRPRGVGSAAGAAPCAELEFDAVVVGSGAGGGPAAAVLAAGGLRVLVVEKGSWRPMTDLTWMEAESFREMYEEAGFITTDDGALSILAGATLGGGTKINWCASLRTPPHVRAEWAGPNHGLPAFKGPEFDAALDAVCARLGVWSGTLQNGSNGALAAGLRELGAEVSELPRNCSSDACSGYCNMGCRSGHKASGDVTWLADAARRGARILTGCSARRLLLEPTAPGGARRGNGSADGSADNGANGGAQHARPRRVVGLEVQAAAMEGGTPVTLVVHAPLVVASCGTLHTPALLLRSGVTVGGNVGAHLRLHPATGVVGRFERSAEQASVGEGAINMHKGVMMLTYSRAVAHWESGGYGAMVSVPALHPGLLAAIAPWASGEPQQLRTDLLALNDLACSVVFTRDSGSGRVRVDAAGRPLPSYWPCETTRRHLLEGLELAVRAYVAAGAVEVFVPHVVELRYAAGPEHTPQRLDAFIRRLWQVGVTRYDAPLFSAHQMGSCRMGASPRTSVCDGSGQCWDVEGLYIADASAFPTASGVNPMITTSAISYMVASGIVRRRKLAKKA